ncbi:MAG: YigZ family protein, partial [Chitinophagaceae bacterium]
PVQYFTINQQASAEYKDRNSKFIAYAFPFPDKNDLKKHLDDLKKMHVKAGHFCFAYRIGVDGNEFRSSDNGEPSGTAGKPILGQIDKQNLCDILIIVVRYFGGTLLGVPGLTNAYKTTASLVLQMLPVITKDIETSYQLHFPYERLNEIMQVIKSCNARIIQQENLLFCSMQLMLPAINLQQFLDLMEKVQGLEIKELK